jgi:hypothetical protein
MTNRLNRVAEVIGDAAGTLEAAAVSGGSKARESLDDATAAIAKSDIADRIDKRTGRARKAIAKRIVRAKKVAKKRATTASNKATGAKKVAKKRATTASNKATGAKKGSSTPRR